VQVNGKVRAVFEATVGISEEAAIREALEISDVQKWMDGKSPKKTIFVKGKIVSIVV
jgi:leucyl-tRNA synthetase